MRRKVLIFLFISSMVFGGGRIVYPGKGNICFEEGTIEMWVKLDFEPDQTSKEYKLLLPLFQFYEPEIKGNISISYICQAGGRALWYVAFDCSGEKLFRISAVPQNWKKGEWHHIGLTWKGNIAKFYLDGKLIEEAKSNRPLSGQVKEGKIFIGDRWSAENIKTEVVIDELRISNIERKQEELGFYSSESLKVDPFTLLLENFEEISEGEKTLTKPVFISGLSGEKGGEVSGVKIVDGKFGKGLSLH